MTLIYGLCLPRKIYLVSDSRLSSSDGSYADDFGKWVDLNPRLGLVVANSAHMASWMIRKITQHVRREAGWEWDFTELEQYLRDRLKSLADEYYAETGNYTHSVNFIFGGFERNAKLVVESSRLGNAMSAPVMAAGEGVAVSQTADMEIMDAFRPIVLEGQRNGRPVVDGTTFEVDLPRPRVLAVSVRATDAGSEVIFEDTMCFDGVAFNPGYRAERLVLPAELLGQLNFRDMSGESAEGVIYGDVIHLIPYTHRLIIDRNWDTVGGELTPLLITPETMGIATGQYIRTDSTGRRYTGGIGQVGGRVHYYDQDGVLRPFRFIHDYLDGDLSVDSDARL